MTRGIEAGVSAAYASALLGEEATRRFGVRAVLLDGSHTDAALAGELQSLGTYTHYEVVPAAPPVPRFSLLAALFMGRSWTIVPEPNRPKVRPQDGRGCDAVLLGMSGSGIDIARRLQ